MRARPPDRSGYAVNDGVRLAWEQAGSEGPAVFLLPPWSIVDSRCWKGQVPYLARRFRVITADPRGNGRSDRPSRPEQYADRVLATDAIAVLDAAGIDSAVLVGLSMGARIALQVADAHPDRVRGLVLLGSALQAGPPPPAGWARDLPGFARHFFGAAFPEPHSSKAIDDAVDWAAGTDTDTLVATKRAPSLGEPAALEIARRLNLPSLVVHGDEDRIAPVATGGSLAEALRAEFVVVEGGGHCVQARHPVRVNVMLRRFLESLA